MAYGLLSLATSYFLGFKPIKVGGGGYMRTINVSPDGTTILSNSDVVGCFLYDLTAGKWNDLLNTGRGFSVTGPGNYAAYGMASAPSQPTTIYMYVNDGNLYRSMDRGASFVKLSNFGPYVGETNNGPTRFFAPRVAVDPINPDVVYICVPPDSSFGTVGNVYVTTNGTSATPTFSVVSGIATAAQPDGYLIAFDKDGGSSSGRTNVAYIFSNGTGCYRATALGTGGGFTLTTGGPTFCSHMQVAPTTSVLYACDETAHLHKCTAGTWANTAADPAYSPFAVAIDPTQAGQRIVIADLNGNLAVSTNAGAAWTNLGTASAYNSPQIPWLGITATLPDAVGDIVFNGTTLMLCDGVGIWTCVIPNSGSYQWTSQTQGIENLVTNGILISPNTTGTPCGYAWDRSIFYVSNPDTYSATQQPYYPDPFGLEITMTWGMDWASSDKNTLVSLGFHESPFLDVGATSSNNGVNWTLNPPASDAVWSDTTNAASSVGANTLSFAATFPITSYLMQVFNLTHPSSIPAGTYLTASNGSTQVTLSQNIASPGVSSGDTIVMKYASSPYMRVLQTNAQTASGAVLHFASVPSYIKPGMFLFDYSNGTALVGGGSPAQVLSISGGDVTMNQPIVSTVASGDFIFFYWGVGGAIAAASPTNWVACLGQNAAFPAVTNDGGATWSIIDIPGVPRIGTCTVTNGSDVVSNLSFNTSNLVVGGSFNNSYASFPGGTTVGSIIDATSFHASTPATGVSKSPDLILPVTGWGQVNYINLKNVAADRVTASTFYLYNYVIGKVYTSTLSGASGTWSAANSNNLATLFGMVGGQNAAMKSVPYLGGTNTAGHLFMTNGFFSSGSFIRSTDGGVTWSTVSNVSGVGAFGFGAAKPGNSYPAVYIWGSVSGVLGTYRSDDNCSTWTRLGTDANPMGTVQGVNDIDGDKSAYGKFYYGLSSNGWGYYG